MSWPPRGVDLSLTDRLRRQSGVVQRQEQAILDIGRDLTALMEERNRRAPGPDVLRKAEELVSRAKLALEPTYTMLAGRICGEILLEMNDVADALARFQAVRAGYASVVARGGAAERDNDVQLLTCIARAQVGIKDAASASERCGEAIAEIERDRCKISVPYQQSAFLKGRASVYARGVALAFQLGDYETMLARAELSKARSVMRIQYGKQVPPQDPVLRRFRELCDQIRQIDPAGDAPPRSPNAPKTALGNLLEERRQLWDLLAIARFGGGDGTSAGAPFSLRALQNAIEPETAILYYYWLDQQVLLVVAIDRRRVVAAPVVLGDQDCQRLRLILNVVRSCYTGLDQELERKFERAIEGCAALIPENVRQVIDGKCRLLFSPHRKLHLFPFHALPWKAAFLIESFAVSYVPNLSILLGPVPPSPNPKVLVAGTGQFPGLKLSPLSAIGPELKGVAEAYRQEKIETTMLEGAKFTRKQVLDWNDNGTLESFSCIHVASHGASVLGDDAVDTPMESRLFLFDSAWDGLEISSLRLRADLVVLSACNSGQRAISGRKMEELPGDDVFGIQSALAMTGAKAVVGCLWPALDAAAQAIMVGFHKNKSKQQSPEVALQLAVVEYLRQSDGRHCYAWAPYFLSVLGPRLKTQERTPVEKCLT
jgi:CHAT domain-containing protein